MKLRRRILLGTVTVLAAWIAVLAWAGTTNEVVFLSTKRADGEIQRTPLWIVDYEKSEWLRTRTPRTQWYVQLQSDPRVELERAGVTAVYRATPVPEATPVINELMAEKYGLADRIVPLIAPWVRGEAMAIRLEPWPM